MCVGEGETRERYQKRGEQKESANMVVASGTRSSARYDVRYTHFRDCAQQTRLQLLRTRVLWDKNVRKTCVRGWEGARVGPHPRYGKAKPTQATDGCTITSRRKREKLPLLRGIKLRTRERERERKKVEKGVGERAAVAMQRQATHTHTAQPLFVSSTRA